MKRKIVSIVFLFLLIFTASCGCSKEYEDREEEKPTYEVPTYNYDRLVSTSDGEISLNDLLLAQSLLLCEDGISGKINLNSTVDEISTILNENGIPFELLDNDEETGEGTIITADGSLFHTGYDAYFYVNMVNETVHGGQKAKQAVEIYGEPDVVFEGAYANSQSYIYNMGKIPCKVAENKLRTVIFEIPTADEVIIFLQIRFASDWEEEEWFDG